MADEVREEDEWLYGESGGIEGGASNVSPSAQSAEIKPDVSDETVVSSAGELATTSTDGTPEDAEGEAEPLESRKRPAEDDGDGTGEADDGGGSSSNDNDNGDSEDDDDSDDDVVVTIGDIKNVQTSQPGQAGPFAAKRAAGPPPDKKGKFSTEDFDGPGQINGVTANDFNLDAIEEKPWRKPGADITDYFNYGFTEDTWKAYCDRQRRLRYESGNPLIINPMNKNMNMNMPLNQGPMGNHGPPGIGGDIKFIPGSQPITFPRRIGMMNMNNNPNFNGPPMNRNGPNMPMRPPEARENTIQVMTADRREYSRKQYDMQMHPPPGMGMPPPHFDMGMPPPFPPPDFMGPPRPPHDYFGHQGPNDYYDEGPNYEDQQQWMDSQWEMEGEGQRMGPGPSALVVPLTKAANIPPPPGESESDNHD